MRLAAVDASRVDLLPPTTLAIGIHLLALLASVRLAPAAPADGDLSDGLRTAAVGGRASGRRLRLLQAHAATIRMVRP